MIKAHYAGKAPGGVYLCVIEDKQGYDHRKNLTQIYKTIGFVICDKDALPFLADETKKTNKTKNEVVAI